MTHLLVKKRVRVKLEKSEITFNFDRPPSSLSFPGPLTPTPLISSWNPMNYNEQNLELQCSLSSRVRKFMDSSQGFTYTSITLTIQNFCSTRCESLVVDEKIKQKLKTNKHKDQYLTLPTSHRWVVKEEKTS